jgi:hypothetical protein
MKECVFVSPNMYDIENGTRRECRRCPLAKAFAREHPEVYDFWIEAYEVFIQWVKDGELERYLMSHKAVEFVRAFDHSDIVEPTTLELFRH